VVPETYSDAATLGCERERQGEVRDTEVRQCRVAIGKAPTEKVNKVNKVKVDFVDLCSALSSQTHL